MQPQAPSARGTSGSTDQINQSILHFCSAYGHVVAREEMGSCVSRSPASASTPGSSERRAAATAKVVGMDGSMVQYSALVTAGEALRDDKRASLFLCSSDELRFDAPPRALADDDELQPGCLYFVLPVSMLCLALSGHEMAALAVRASSALAVASGAASPPRRKTGGRVAGHKGRQRKTARVAPLVALDENDEQADGGARKTFYGDEKAVKTRKRAGYRSRHTRRRAAMPKLSPILEVGDF